MRARTPAPKLLRSLLIAGVAAGLAGQATFAALTDATDSSANTVTVGTVDLVDDDGGGVLLSLAEADSGQSDQSCIRVTYRGSLKSAVRLYGSTASPLAPHLLLDVERGTMPTAIAFPDCGGFVADGGPPLFSGRLSDFPTGWAGGLQDAEEWTTDEDHVYRFTLRLDPDGSGQGVAGGGATFTWRAETL